MRTFTELEQSTKDAFVALSVRLAASWARHAPLDDFVRGLSTTRGNEARAALIYESSTVVLAHDGAPDPCFVYANHGAQTLFGYDLDTFIGMPSRLSARTAQRDERASMLRAALEDGYYEGYRGVRVRADGSLFMMDNAVIWTVYDAAGRPMGQAARFSDFREY